MWLIAVAVLVFAVCPSIAFAENVQYSGSLVVVTKHSVWVRTANGVVACARLPDAGDLSAQTLAGRYRVGQQVLMKAVIVPQFRDDEDNRMYDFELKALTYLRPASQQELAGALGSPARRVLDNLLPVAESDDPMRNISLKTLKLPDGNETFDAKLERSRVVTEQYLAALPDFNADESALLRNSPVSSTPKWRIIETLNSEVSFRGVSTMRRIRESSPLERLTAWSAVWN